MNSKSIYLTFTFLFWACSVCYAGYGSSEGSSYHKFQYDIKGEIEIKPDYALFPFIVTVESKDFKSSLMKAKKIISEVEKKLKTLGKPNLSISSADFFEPHEYKKRIYSSFFGEQKGKAKAQISSYFAIKFSEEDKFWDRAQYIASALDFLKGCKIKFEGADKIKFTYEEAVYHIENAEEYREKIVKSIYSKAKKAANIIAKQENKKPIIKEIKFDQMIIQEILNFNKASLSLDATIEFGFE
jgi:hypothetical protein